MKLALRFTYGRLSVIHCNMEVKVRYVAQAAYQLPMLVRQFPETAVATAVSSNTAFFHKLPTAFCHLAYPHTKRNTGTLNQA